MTETNFKKQRRGYHIGNSVSGWNGEQGINIRDKTVYGKKSLKTRLSDPKPVSFPLYSQAMCVNSPTKSRLPKSIGKKNAEFYSNKERISA